jgi:hypothetical protein
LLGRPLCTFAKLRQTDGRTNGGKEIIQIFDESERERERNGAIAKASEFYT